MVRAGLLLLGLSRDGTHSVQARTVTPTAADPTPVDVVWTIDEQAPVLAFVQTPAIYSAVPASSATFLLSTTAPLETAFHYLVTAELTSGNWSSVTQFGYVDDDGLSVSSSAVIVVPYLTPGFRYHIAVHGVDGNGNVGLPVEWTWSTASCPDPANVTLSGVVVVPTDYYAKVVLWQPYSRPELINGYEYSLDGSDYIAVPSPSVTLPFLMASRAHTLSVRAAVSPACSAFSYDTYPAATASWQEYDLPPGTVSFVSTPDHTMTSAYAEFVFSSTALPGLTQFQYLLDTGVGFIDCGSTLSLGTVLPFRVCLLSAGGHVVAVVVVWGGCSVPCSVVGCASLAMGKGRESWGNAVVNRGVVRY